MNGEPTQEDIKEMHRNRAAMYALLGSMFRREPDSQLLDILRNVLESASGSGDLYASKYSEIYGYIIRNDIDVQEELAVDFARALLGVGKKQTGGAFPYESVYTSRQGAMMQKAMDEVTAIYAQNGFAVDSSVGEPADHIYIEFEFLARLADAAAELDGAGLAKNIGTQKMFLKEHILNWVPRFCSDLEKFAETPYYKALAVITDAFVKLDNETLAHL